MRRQPSMLSHAQMTNAVTMTTVFAVPGSKPAQPSWISATAAGLSSWSVAAR